MKSYKPRKPSKDYRESDKHLPEPPLPAPPTPATTLGCLSLFSGLTAIMLALYAVIYQSTITEQLWNTLIRIPFLLVVIAIIVGIAAIMVTKRRGIKAGQKLAVIGIVTGVAGLFLASSSLFVASQKNATDENREFAAETINKLIGYWQNESEENESVEFTKGGAVILTRRYQDRDDPNETRSTIKYGRFKIEDKKIHVREDDDWHERNDRWDSKHTFEFITADRLLFGPSNHSSFYNFQGKWKRISEDANTGSAKVDWTP